MDLSHDFYYKHKLAVTGLARDFFMMERGEKLPTITGSMEKFGVSRGTVQLAMRFLQDQECIRSRFKGKRGSYLLDKDDEKLWQFTGYGVLTGGMYLPFKGMAAGLATGICDCMTRARIPFACSFFQGSQTRIQALLRKKNDFVVASRLTARLVEARDDLLEWTMDLPGTRYAGEYVLAFRRSGARDVRDGMTVAVDPTSMDQDHLTGLVCREKRVERLEVSYTNTPKAVEQGLADVAVARMDVIEQGYPGLVAWPIRVNEYDPAEIRSFSEAVILINRDNYGIDGLLRKVIDPAQVAQAQAQVMENKRFSRYY